MNTDFSMAILRGMFEMHLAMLNNGDYDKLRNELEAGIKATKNLSDANHEEQSQ